MDLQLNHNDPAIMHIDLNSCFATVEQQANPLIRGKPVVVAAYKTPSGCVIAPSIEAKKVGIRVGMTVRDAKLLYKNVIVLTPDPPKYRTVHMQFSKLFKEYSPNVTPKSIDEAVIDFANTPALKRGLIDIALEIKQRMRKEIGEWISCSIGIGTNRFLAKTAASLQKPDGLHVITHKNARDIYSRLELIDLCGINTRFQARLNTSGIFTPLEFLDASLDLLKKQVFKSIVGYYWFLRLRGWEIDAVDFSRKSYGQSYALAKRTSDPKELSVLLMKLCEKMGRRLRLGGYCAQGIHVSCLYSDMTHWHQGKTLSSPVYSTQELYTKAQLVLNKQPEKKVVTHLAVSCFHLQSKNIVQLELFESDQTKLWKVTDAMDIINDKYGEYVVTPALMMGMDELIIDRIAFGGVKDLENLYV